MNGRAIDPVEIAMERIASAAQGHHSSLILSGLGLTALPDGLGRLNALTCLDLHDNQLTALPDGLGRLTAVTELDLGGNQLTALPSGLGQLTALTHLDIHDNQLTALPDDLGQLNALRRLDLHGNQLTALPDWIGGLTVLRRLDLRGNQLTVLPEGLDRLTAVTLLHLRGNQLTALPDSIGQLNALIELDLGGNQLTWLPDGLGQLTALTQLRLDGNQLTALPDALGQLAALTSLDLYGNRLTALPEPIGSLTVLRRLELGSNQLTALPEWIGRLIGLSELGLNGNQLTALPDGLGRIAALHRLELGGNRLTALPEDLDRLTLLRRLDLGDNQLTALPEWIGRLTALTELDLRGNQLTTLPDSIGWLTALSHLDLRDNRLTSLPDGLGWVSALAMLDLDGNRRLSSPPPEVAAQGMNAVQGFLQGRARSSVELWRSKVLIVGEATVGKTSLAKQLFGEAFDPDERQTHGLRVRPMPLPHPDRPGVTMDLDVWDFGGQLEYRATQRFYLTNRSLFLLVWNSRARAADGKITAWLDTITARAPDAPILIVATHGDEHSPATLPHNLTERYRAIVAIHTVDSRTGSGIDVLRAAIIHHAAALPLMGARWPTDWDQAGHALDQLPGLTTTTHHAFTAMAEVGVTDPAAQQAIARTLHDLGQIAYFTDFPDLATRIILSPQWLDERIAQAIDSEAVTAAGGLLSRAERHRLWGALAASEDDPDLPDRLIRMMEAFDLAYRVGNPDDSTDVALIVDRLPDAPPPDVDRIWHEQRAAPGARETAIIYKLASRQAGIPTYFLARAHPYTIGLHWKHGALLHDRDPDTPAWALITDDGREQPTLTLRVTGAYPVRFLSVLTETFDRIVTARYPGLVEARLVPCACRIAEGGTCPQTFTLKRLLLEAASPGDGTVLCEESERRIEAALMLDGLRGTGLTAHLDARHRELAASLDELRRQTTAHTGTLTAIDARQQAQLNGIRTLLEHRANTDTHGPALFSIWHTARRGLRPARTTLTLWCEWPAGPHPLTKENGSYTITRSHEALAHYLPYLRALITTLGLAAPVLGAAGHTLSDLAQDRIEAAARTLEFIEQHTQHAPAPPDGKPSPYGQWTVQAETGADIRALRALLAVLDPEKHWGGLSPASRPEDRRTLYLCPHHIHELDYPYTATGTATSPTPTGVPLRP